jgi:hypothetical protein
MRPPDVEHALARNEVGRGPRFGPKNFPVIDHFGFSNGVAASDKSLDVRAKTYANTKALDSRIRGYIDKVSQFKGGQAGGAQIKSSDIKSRVLNLTIPEGAATQEQKAVIDANVKYGESVGVKVNVYEAK